MTALVLPLKVDLKHIHLMNEQFYQLCVNNPDLNIELSADGALSFMSSLGGESGNQEIKLGTDLNIWNRQSNSGKVFSSSTLFRLPGGGGVLPMRRGWSFLAGSH